MNFFGGQRASALALVAAAALAGCVSAFDPQGVVDDAAGAAVLTVGGASAAAGELLVFTGSELTGDCAGPDECPELSAPFSPHRPYSECHTTNCERTPLVVGADAEGATLVAIARWAVQDENFASTGEYIGAEHVSMRIGLVPVGADEAEGLWLTKGKYGSVGRFTSVAPGDYELVAIADWGVGTYDVGLRFVDADASAPEGELLPDLVMGPPRQIRVEMPLGREADPAFSAGGSAGCGPDEYAEEGGRRCLRFASDLGNAGVGKLELFLPKQDAILARADAADAQWHQRVYAADGSFREEPVSAADYHPTHGHYHIRAFAQTFLYAHDEATGERGELVAEGGKTGFCVVDGGPIDLASTWAATPLGLPGCCYMTALCELDTIGEAEEYVMGISVGWFDVYPWWRSGQYVDVTGVEDGVYELVSVVNPDGNVIEADAANNRGGVVLRLTGDEVELLSSWTEADEGAFAWSGAAADA